MVAAVWIASSLVGTTTSTCTEGSSLSTIEMAGMAYAPVFPVPVLAFPMMLFALQYKRDCLFLYGRRFFVAHIVNCLKIRLNFLLIAGQKEVQSRQTSSLSF